MLRLHFSTKDSIIDSLGEDCATCNAPCIEGFYECSGLPTERATVNTTLAPMPTTSTTRGGIVGPVDVNNLCGDKVISIAPTTVMTLQPSPGRWLQ